MYPRAVHAIIRRHYMDDYLDSVDTVEDAIKLINEVATIHERGGFEICKWTSNNIAALRVPLADKLDHGAVNLTPDQHMTTKTLGLI